MQTIGERLEEARKRKGVSIREAAEATKIRSDYLHRFEGNQFDLDLADIYVRGFLRTYAVFLKLPDDKILNDYDALGQRRKQRPRQPNREVYGRMDLSIASAEDRAAERPAPASPPEEARSEAAAAGEGASRPTRLPRSGSSLPKGPPIDPTLVFRGGIVLVALLVILLVIWGVKVIFTGEHTAAPVTNPSNPIQMASESTITLVALNRVRVKVARVSDGKELFQGTLERGDTKVVPHPGPLYITAKDGKDLQVEVNGKRYAMPFTGYDRAKID